MSNEYGWISAHPEISALQVAVADLNGQGRGKRLPVRYGEKALSGAVRMPLSALSVDIRGDDVEASPLVFESGDRDGVLRPTDRGFVPLPWLDTPSALLPTWMYTDAGAAFDGDPRHALDTVLARYRERGWDPVAATELEFYLIDDSGDRIRPAQTPRSGRPHRGGDILATRALDAFDAFFTDLYAACGAMDIPAETAISESGAGQFEVNLVHGPAMKAADDAWLFKMLVKGMARKHGFAASFMAKPFAGYAGNGLHVHFSVMDRAGRNIFDDGGPGGSDLLRHAIAGCLAAMPASTLIFAPHGNSYDRMVPDAHAPTGIAWAYENRTTAIRVPGGAPAARRIEHRVAGGDINPYLMLAVVLGAAFLGIDDKIDCPPPVTGNAYALDLPQLPTGWRAATEAFAHSDVMARLLPENLIRSYVLMKTQEQAIYAALSEKDRVDLYLDTV